MGNLEEQLMKEKGNKKNIVVLLGDPNKTDIVKPGSIFGKEDFDTVNRLKTALGELKEYNFSYLSNHDTLIHDLINIKDKVYFVFNLCDEGFMNDPKKELHITSFLEMLEIPYTGAGPRCLAYCYDKSLTKAIAKEIRIPVAQEISLDRAFDFPVIVKPNFGDASIGITQKSVAHNPEELLDAISEMRNKFNYKKSILTEEFLTGKDLSVGIIGNPLNFGHILPIIEEDYSAIPENLPKLGCYESKWLPDSPYWKISSIPANIPENVKTFIGGCCLKLFERLECRDYARFDWRLDSKGNPKLLEVNPNPGWCWDGHLAKMATFAGLSYAEMLKAILNSAEQRISVKE